MQPGDASATGGTVANSRNGQRVDGGAIATLLTSGIRGRSRSPGRAATTARAQLLLQLRANSGGGARPAPANARAEVEAAASDVRREGDTSATASNVPAAAAHSGGSHRGQPPRPPEPTPRNRAALLRSLRESGA